MALVLLLTILKELPILDLELWVIITPLLLLQQEDYLVKSQQQACLEPELGVVVALGLERPTLQDCLEALLTSQEILHLEQINLPLPGIVW